MRIDTLGVEAFIAIAEQGGFGKAAATLHITQTALTRRLQNLEVAARRAPGRAHHPLGRADPHRPARSCRRRAGCMSDLTSALVELRETGQAQRGNVSIACVPTVGVQYLPRIIQAYSARYPENRIKILDHASSGVAEAVLRREAEFGINIAGPHHPELASVAAARGPLRPDLPLRPPARQAHARHLEGARVAPADLRRRGQRQPPAARRPRSRRSSLSLHAFYEVQRSSTAVGLVAEGVAAAVVPSLALQKGAYPRIRVVALVDPVVSRTLVLVSRKTAQLSPAAQALYDMIRGD